MSELAIFAFQEKQIRTVVIGGEPWFVAKDICNALEIGNPSQALSRLESDEKGLILNDTLGGKQELAIVSESGMYALVLGSRKPEAKAFRKWVTSEVIPSIRKTGSYQLNQQQPAQPQQPALPPADVRVANLVGALEKLDIDINNPRFKQGLQDISLNILGVTDGKPALAAGEQWLGVAERAEQLGYSSSLVIRHRSQLGKAVKSRGLTPRAEHRLCNGTQRLVNLYQVCPELDGAISGFLDAKLHPAM